jgi:hypothetical protein
VQTAPPRQPNIFELAPEQEPLTCGERAPAGACELHDALTVRVPAVGLFEPQAEQDTAADALRARGSAMSSADPTAAEAEPPAWLEGDLDEPPAGRLARRVPVGLRPVVRKLLVSGAFALAAFTLTSVIAGLARSTHSRPSGARVEHAPAALRPAFDVARIASAAVRPTSTRPPGSAHRKAPGRMRPRPRRKRGGNPARPRAERRPAPPAELAVRTSGDVSPPASDAAPARPRTATVVSDPSPPIGTPPAAQPPPTGTTSTGGASAEFTFER